MTEQPYGNQPPPPPGGYGQMPPPPGAPAPGYGGPGGQKPDNFLVLTILATVFCCLPIGGYAIYLATQVDKKWFAGDVAGAQEASKNAKKFAIIAAAVGVVLAIISVIINVAVIGSMETSY